MPIFDLIRFTKHNIQPLSLQIIISSVFHAANHQISAKIEKFTSLDLIEYSANTLILHCLFYIF